MSFFDRMSEQQQSNSAELFLFTRTDFRGYYTTYHKDLISSGNTWQAATLKRSNIPSVFHAREVVCTITGSTKEGQPFAFLIDTLPDVAVRVLIYRQFLDNWTDDWLVIFEGYMRSFTLSKSLATVQFETLNYLTRYKIPRIAVQTYCNHRLFDNNCTLDKVAYKIGGTVIDTSDNPDILPRQFVVSAGYNDGFGHSMIDKIENYFVNGVAHFNGHYRHISNSFDYNLSGSQKVINLQQAFPSGAGDPGVIIDLWPGCLKSIAACENTFDNLINFLGFPWAMDAKDHTTAVQV